MPDRFLVEEINNERKVLLNGFRDVLNMFHIRKSKDKLFSSTPRSFNCSWLEISGKQTMLSILQEGESLAAGTNTFWKSLSPLSSSSLALSRASFRSSLSAFPFWGQLFTSTWRKVLEDLSARRWSDSSFFSRGSLLRLLVTNFSCSC